MNASTAARINAAIIFTPADSADESTRPAMTVGKGAQVYAYVDNDGTLIVSAYLDGADDLTEPDSTTVPIRITVNGETVYTAR